MSARDGSADNMLIQGDNFEVPKAPLSFHASRVNRIHIAPPHDTRPAFEHHDDDLDHTRWLGPLNKHGGGVRKRTLEVLAVDADMFADLEEEV